jgi:hypothetical protein
VIFHLLSFWGRLSMQKLEKRLLVEMLHEQGVSIPYDRVLEASAQLGDAAVSKYTEEE